MLGDKFFKIDLDDPGKPARRDARWRAGRPGADPLESMFDGHRGRHRARRRTSARTTSTGRRWTHYSVDGRPGRAASTARSCLEPARRPAARCSYDLWFDDEDYLAPGRVRRSAQLGTVELSLSRLGRRRRDRGAARGPGDPDLGRCSRADRQGLSGRAGCRACPSCWSAPGPWASGSSDRWASSALSRLRTSVISAGLTWRPSFWTWRTSLGSGTWPSPLPHDDLVDRDLGGDPLVLAALAGHQLAQPVGVALADQHDARGADDPVHDVLLLGERDRRVGLPAAAQHPQRRGGRAGLALHLAVRRVLGAPAEHDHRGEQAEHEAADDRHDPLDQPAAGQHLEEHEAERADDEEDAPSSQQADPPVGLAWPSGRSRRTA